ncbi:MFS transporter [Ameyamaea chiangmaiensis]|nr:MFS transporter [Ameyamaea chiangmaiensis]
MPIDRSTLPHSHGARASTSALFFVTGAVVAAWGVLVPFVRMRAHLDHKTLGALLLCVGLGALAGMPASGLLAARFGCRAVVAAAMAVVAAAFPVLASARALPPLVIALGLMGAALGIANCVVNIQAVIVEQAARRPMMSGFHGFFSMGGIAGAVVMGGLLSLGASPLTADLLTIGGLMLVVVAFVAGMLPFGADHPGPAFVIPHGIVILIGALCAVAFLTEGAVLDWSGVFLNTRRGLDARHAGVGYALFAIAMTLGRLCGNRLVTRLGMRRVVALGGIVAAAGLLLVALIPSVPVSLAGFALTGAGCANIVPVLYSAAGRQTAMPGHAAVPAVTTLGSAGELLGPALVGFVAQGTSLDAALVLLAGGMAGVGLCGRLLRVGH